MTRTLSASASRCRGAIEALAAGHRRGALLDRGPPSILGWSFSPLLLTFHVCATACSQAAARIAKILNDIRCSHSDRHRYGPSRTNGRACRGRVRSVNAAGSDGYFERLRTTPVDSDHNQGVRATRQNRVRVDDIFHRIAVSGFKVADFRTAGGSRGEDVKLVVCSCNVNLCGSSHEYSFCLFAFCFFYRVIAVKLKSAD